jgi:hypothetical protein
MGHWEMLRRTNIFLLRLQVRILLGSPLLMPMK